MRGLFCAEGVETSVSDGKKSSKLTTSKNHQKKGPISSKPDVFRLLFEEYLSLPDEDREAIQWQAYQSNQSWINGELDRLGAEWLLICGGKVIEFSSTLRDYPSREKLIKLGNQRNFVPFVFVRESLIEESAWSLLPRSDFYPTLQILIGPSGCRSENLAERGVTFVADFDTGSPNLFLDYDQLLSRNIIDRQPIDQTHFRQHLGQIYRFHIMHLVLGVIDEQGTVVAQEFPALCVRGWRQSPLCRVNPNRHALAGRSLLLEFHLRLELDARQRATRVLR